MENGIISRKIISSWLYFYNVALRQRANQSDQENVFNILKIIIGTGKGLECQGGEREGEQGERKEDNHQNQHTPSLGHHNLRSDHTLRLTLDKTEKKEKKGNSKYTVWDGAISLNTTAQDMFINQFNDRLKAADRIMLLRSILIIPVLSYQNSIQKMAQRRVNRLKCSKMFHGIQVHLRPYERATGKSFHNNLIKSSIKDDQVNYITGTCV